MELHEEREGWMDQIADNLRQMFPLEDGAYFEYGGNEAEGGVQSYTVDGGSVDGKSLDDFYRDHVNSGNRSMHVTPLIQMNTPEGPVWYAKWLCLIIPDRDLPYSPEQRLRDSALLLRRHGIDLYLANNPDNSRSVYVLLSEPMPLSEAYAPLRGIAEVLQIVDDTSVVSREIMDDPTATRLSAPDTMTMPYRRATDGFGDFCLDNLCAGEEVYAYKPYSEVNTSHTDPESLIRFAEDFENGDLDEELSPFEQHDPGRAGLQNAYGGPRRSGGISSLLRLARGFRRTNHS
jgi:hypothetical protein